MVLASLLVLEDVAASFACELAPLSTVTAVSGLVSDPSPPCCVLVPQAANHAMDRVDAANRTERDKCVIGISGRVGKT
jgi:hypothetical protein